MSRTHILMGFLIGLAALLGLAGSMGGPATGAHPARAPAALKPATPVPPQPARTPSRPPVAAPAGPQAPAQITGFTDAGAGLTAVNQSTAAWGDYDNDGRLDLLIIGSASGAVLTTILYHNTVGGFVDVTGDTSVFSTPPPGVKRGSVAWGDYDNDGRLDFLVTGCEDDDCGFNLGALYHNTAGGFVDVSGDTSVFSTPPPGLADSRVAWGDYDNDGRLDFLLTGAGFGGRATLLYHNTVGGFVDVSGASSVFPTPPPPVDNGSMAWGDYDNDGRLDFLLTGYDGSNTVGTLYQNTAGGFVDVTAGFFSPALPALWFSSVAWGDYDNDGRLDFLLTGYDNGFSTMSKLYRNTGSGFAETAIAGLPQVADGNAVWGDYDNDGQLDFWIAGCASLGCPSASAVYHNDGAGSFTDVTTTTFGSPLSVDALGAWGDYDNDGKLDLLLTGGSTRATLYQNQTATANTIPAAPTGLNATGVTNSSATLNWSAAVDTQTVALGLNYNLRVGTTPGGSDILAPMADPASGWRRIPALGPARPSLSAVLVGLSAATTYYWSVQAIDPAWAGSPWGAEGSFTTNTATATATATATPTGCPVLAASPTPVAWTDIGNVDGTSPTLQKTGGGNGWNAGAVSLLALNSGDGYAEWTVANTSSYVMAGLGHDDTDQSYQDVDYAFYTYAALTTLQVVENGTRRVNVGAYAAGDVLRIAVDQGVVKYYQNCMMVYSSAVAPTYPLLFDDSLYTPNAQIVNAALAGTNLVTPPTPTVPPTAVAWQHLAAVSASGNTITKTGATGWNAGAVSTKAIGSGDGGMLATVADISSYFMVGLSNGDTNASYQDIDFALYTYANGHTLLVYEGGTYRKSIGGYNAGDVLRVAAESGTIYYYQNGQKVYTSTGTLNYPLLLDTSLYTTGGQVANAQLSSANLVNVPAGLVLTTTPVAWKNGVGVISSTNTLTKTNATAAWNAGAVSTLAIPVGADGYVETTVATTTSYLMFGLSNGDTNQTYPDIDFAFYPHAGTLSIYEAGALKASVGPYVVGDVLRVEVATGVVRYYRNGALLYVSSVPPTLPLLLDTSIYSPGGRVQNAQIAGTSLAPSKPAPPGTRLAKPGRPQPPPAALPPGGKAAPTRFGDVPADSPLGRAVAWAAEQGSVGGYSDGTFRPDAAMTRGQLAKLLAGAAGSNTAIPPTQQTFADVAPGSPFWAAVEGLANDKRLAGYACGGAPAPCDAAQRPYYRPDAPATRGQAALLLAGVAGLAERIPATRQTFKDVAPGSPSWAAVERLAARGSLAGYADGTFRPAAPLTRGQAVQLAARLFAPGAR